MSESITLTCPACGNTLDIGEDISLFACASCGREHVVRRGGSIVSLAPAPEDAAPATNGAEQAMVDANVAQIKTEINQIQEALWEEKQGIPQESLYNFFLMLDDRLHERRGTKRQRPMLGMFTRTESREHDVKGLLYSLTIEDLDALIGRCSELSSKGIPMDHYETRFNRLKRLKQQLPAQKR
ncbi:MAG: hypothetical protein H8E35_16465 [Ardenticatenia bacterium]|nr:hypothetical protein [Ardenticatenia bacterium]